MAQLLGIVHKALKWYRLDDLLRNLISTGWPDILSRTWLIPELDIQLYGNRGGYAEYAIRGMFPEAWPVDPKELRVRGERLLERAAFLFTVEEALMLRIVDPDKPVILDPDYWVFKGPPAFQATNVDMEIRIGDDEIIVYTEEERIIRHLVDTGYAMPI